MREVFYIECRARAESIDFDSWLLIHFDTQFIGNFYSVWLAIQFYSFWFGLILIRRESRFTRESWFLCETKIKSR